MPIPRDTSLFRLLAILLLVGVGSYLFLSRLSFGLGIPVSNGTPTAGSTPIRIREAVTLSACVENDTRIRRGPSTQDDTIGELDTGTCLTILGRTEDATWVYMVSENHQTGWVSATLLNGAGDIHKVSVRDNSAAANPGRPTLTTVEIAHGAQVYLTQIATNLPDAPLSGHVVPCFETANRVGDYISCRIEKAYCDYLPQLGGRPTFCSDRPAPDHTFALVVFDADWSEYDGQCLIVEGYLELDRGVLQIQGLRRDQVSACH
jgi:hypothetical protein